MDMETEDEYTYWELQNLYNPEQAKEWKKQYKDIPKDWVVVGKEEEVHWSGGSFKVITTDEFADDNGLFYMEDGVLRRIKQMSIWNCKYNGPTKIAINLNSNFQVEQDD